VGFGSTINFVPENSTSVGLVLNCFRSIKHGIAERKQQQKGVAAAVGMVLHYYRTMALQNMA